MHTLDQLRSGRLSGIKRLKLAEGLTHFPEEIFSLADTLEILDLSDNQLTALPEDLPRLKHLRVIFASNNPFTELPRVLGQCEHLEMIGFKANRIKTVPAHALPSKLRWLILTDNAIEKLPDCFSRLSNLQKLMLAGNKLCALPPSLRDCHNLQLLRISANQFPSLPDTILQLPKLAWLAFAGNPFAKWPEETAIQAISSSQVNIKGILGQGASGVISLADLQASELDLPQNAAIKVFKGEVTSDGYPSDELKASLIAGKHNNLVEPLAKIDEPNYKALVMRLISDDYKNLGLPPSLQSCTRDMFPEGFKLTQNQADIFSEQMYSALNHLHTQGICHGDIYAHNTLVNASNHLLFGDFGAASPLSGLTAEQRKAVIAIEQRALKAFDEDMQSLVI